MVFLEIMMHDNQYNVLSVTSYVILASLLGLFIYLYRKQVAVNDKQYLEEMIEHHSMALLTSQEILKKTDDVDAHVSTVLLQEPAEVALFAAMQTVLPQALGQWQAGDYTASLQSLAALRQPVDAFFEGVMVNAEAMDLRLNRLGLLKSLHLAMNRVADLSKLAS